MEDKSISKITYTKNLNKFNFNSTINIPIDSNTSIKTLLDVKAYLFDQKVECSNGKAIFSGKIGVKVLFLDTDNITNTISDSLNFTETYIDNLINSETYLNISDAYISHNVLSTDGILKINCDVNISPIAYLNLSLNNNLISSDLLITKKCEISTNYVSSSINSNFFYVTNLESKSSVDKILCLNSYFSPEKVSAQDGYAVVEGKLSTSILFESISDNDSTIKELHETNNIKQDIEIAGLTKDDILDLSFVVDKSFEEIEIEKENNVHVITLKNKIYVSGVVLKNVSINIVDDVYSVANSIETSISKRKFTKKMEEFSISETISNETVLNTSEPAIDEIISNLNIVPEITNCYVKNNSIVVEGIISSNATYIDENKELKHKQLESPFVIDTKLQAEEFECVHNFISVVDSKIKVKRGTIIETEYTLFIRLSIYVNESYEIVDSFKIGKPLDMQKYDIQIYIAKPNESLWELCKRIKISPEDIHKYNKELPMVMQGGEKIIIKR